MPPDWQDFVGIVLVFINSSIGFYDGRNAGNAVKVLVDSLSPKTEVRHDGKWQVASCMESSRRGWYQVAHGLVQEW